MSEKEFLQSISNECVVISIEKYEQMTQIIDNNRENFKNDFVRNDKCSATAI